MGGGFCYPNVVRILQGVDNYRRPLTAEVKKILFDHHTVVKGEGVQGKNQYPPNLNFRVLGFSKITIPDLSSKILKSRNFEPVSRVGGQYANFSPCKFVIPVIARI